MIKINFAIETEFGTYRDALILPDDQQYTSAQVEEMKQARVNAWLEILRNPPQEGTEGE